MYGNRALCCFILGLAGMAACRSIVGEPEVKRISISPSIGTVLVGGRLQLEAFVLWSAPQVQPASVAWSSLDPDIASVSASGEVIGVSSGDARISATVGSAVDTAFIRVPGPVSVLESSATSLTIPPGFDATVVVRGRTTDGYFVDDPAVTWHSSDSSVATVSSAGVITAVDTGSALVTARFQSVERVIPVTVSPEEGTLAASLDWRMVLLSLDGSSPRQISPSDARETAWSPSWSPDGKRMAFNCGYQICTMDADGNDRKQVTHMVNPSYLSGMTDLSWFPDGSRILAERWDENSGYGSLVAVDPGDSLPEVPVDLPDYEGHARFAPWGTLIAWNCNDHGLSGGFNGLCIGKVTPSDSGPGIQVELFSGVEESTDPSWRDRPRLSMPISVRTSELSIPVENGLVVRVNLPDRELRAPVSSPDGRKIAFLARRGSHTDLMLVDSDGRNLVRWRPPQGRELTGSVSWRP